jgi:hypothetical protein
MLAGALVVRSEREQEQERCDFERPTMEPRAGKDSLVGQVKMNTFK